MKDLNLARGVNMLQNKAYFRSKDEISTLTSSFYSLAQSLQGSYKEMELKNRRLEEEKRKSRKSHSSKI
ncbi:hypothetical protein JCM19241_4904 [Vibrio ishigakensis]|uniref:Uncharacterized protein n=1 Tax=Vibrio ishigakensis TaxID=1481914 RepID=A0A0B8QVN7_9VIBR|nr:hypothetical protein JCM19241_4904 [Vibrio ishigakensis]